MLINIIINVSHELMSPFSDLDHLRPTKCLSFGPVLAAIAWSEHTAAKPDMLRVWISAAKIWGQHGYGDNMGGEPKSLIIDQMCHSLLILDFCKVMCWNCCQVNGKPGRKSLALGKVDKMPVFKPSEVLQLEEFCPQQSSRQFIVQFFSHWHNIYIYTHIIHLFNLVYHLIHLTKHQLLNLRWFSHVSQPSNGDRAPLWYLFSSSRTCACKW